MQNHGSDLQPMLRKLQLWRRFDALEQEALLSLPHRVERLAAHRYIVREEDCTTFSCLLMSGFAYRQKLAEQGARSILALHMSGDVVDLQNSLLEVADHSVQVLTDATVAFIPRQSIIDLALRFPNIGLAMWYDTLVDGSIAREWGLNNSRRRGTSRIAHVICEFGLRLEALGLGTRHNYDFPLTQEQLADAVGMTPVHVNRMLKAMENDQLISRTGRCITVHCWSALVRAGDFRDTYLHLDKARRGDAAAPEQAPGGPVALDAPLGSPAQS
jgi:CRP-like cAMP-binding protein